MKLTSGGKFDGLRLRSTFAVNILTFHGLIDEGTVAEVNKPKEEPVVHGSGQGGHRVEAVVCVLSFYTLVHLVHSVPTLILGRMKLP